MRDGQHSDFHTQQMDIFASSPGSYHLSLINTTTSYKSIFKFFLKNGWMVQFMCMKPLLKIK